MMKKIISVILSIMMLSTMFTGVVFAADTTVNVRQHVAVWHRHDGSTSNDAMSYITYKDDRSTYALFDLSSVLPYVYAAKSVTVNLERVYSSHKGNGLLLLALDDSCEQYVNTSLTSTFAAQNGMTTGYTIVHDTTTSGLVFAGGDKNAIITALETGTNSILAVRFAGAVQYPANSEVTGANLSFTYDDQTYLQDIADYLTWSNVSDVPANQIEAGTIDLPSTLAGCDVTWSSNSPAINTETRVVTCASSEQEVTLTATLSHGGKTAQASFDVVVPAGAGEEPKTVFIPYTNYGSARPGAIPANGIHMNRFFYVGGDWRAVAQLDLSGYEELLRNPGTSLKLSFVSEANASNAAANPISNFTVYLAPDESDVYKANETVYEIIQALGAFDTTRPVLAADNDNQSVSTASTTVTVDASKENLLSVLNEAGSQNSIVTLFITGETASAIQMGHANAGLTISYLESEVEDCIINTPEITIDGDSVSAKFVSYNFTGKEEGYTALLAVYSAGGELLELADPVYVDADGKDETTLSAAYESGCIAKAFVWDNMTDITPIHAATLGHETTDDSQNSIDMSNLKVLIDSSKVTEIKNSTDPLITQWRAKAISDANRALAQGVYDYSKYSTGEMKNISESMNRVMSLGMAYLLTADTKYSDRAYIEVNEFLKMADWNKGSFLDIAEISTIVSIAYDWMYSAWTQTQKDAMIAKLLEAIDYTNKLYKGELPDPNGWIGSTNNWNAVCNGGMAIASMVVMDSNKTLCSQVLGRAMSELNYVLREFAPYGGWEEGPSYWAYTMKYLTALASTLNNVYGTDMGIGDTVGLEDSLLLSVSLEGKTATMNIGDTAASHIYVPEMFYWADYYENPDVNGAALWTLDSFGFEADVFTLIYYNPAYGTSFEKASALYFKGTETVTLESGSTKYDSFIGISGGDAITNHGHLDSGSVIVDMKGERFISDIGAEHYGKDGYFSTKRYLYYRSRPEGHNIFVINPSNELSGSETYYGQSTTAYSEITSFDAAKKEAVLDLTAAYSRDASNASRKISLDGSNVVIEDSITMKTSGEIHWYFHTDATVSISGNTATLTKNGKSITVTFDAGQNSGILSLVPAARFNATTSVEDADNAPYQKLDFKIANASGSVNMEITLAR